MTEKLSLVFGMKIHSFQSKVPMNIILHIYIKNLKIIALANAFISKVQSIWYSHINVGIIVYHTGAVIRQKITHHVTLWSKTRGAASTGKEHSGYVLNISSWIALDKRFILRVMNNFQIRQKPSLTNIMTYSTSNSSLFIIGLSKVEYFNNM